MVRGNTRKEMTRRPAEAELIGRAPLAGSRPRLPCASRWRDVRWL